MQDGRLLISAPPAEGWPGKLKADLIVMDLLILTEKVISALTRRIRTGKDIQPLGERSFTSIYIKPQQRLRLLLKTIPIPLFPLQVAGYQKRNPQRGMD